MPTHVLTTEAVRWSIATLGSQRLHPTFLMYLYLRRRHRAGTLATASASSDELLSLIRVPGNPTKPYYNPLVDRGDRSGTLSPRFWRAPNIPGSWSPGSLVRQIPSAWLSKDGKYALPDDHVERAFKAMLYETRVPALALGAYFLRNDGFVLSREPSSDDVVAGFRSRFEYPADTEDEFAKLFTVDAPAGIDFLWFDGYSPPDAEPRQPVENGNV